MAPVTDQACVEVHGVTKGFRSRFRGRRVVAVKNLTLSVERGSVVALVGPNGAGKTTTLYLILGLLKPDIGCITVLGEKAGSAPSLRRTGFMSEIFYPYPYQTPIEAMRFFGGLSRLSRTEIDRVAPALLRRVGLPDESDRPVGTFSKGMIQRLGLAQALLGDPELLILDEPTTGLDPEGRRLVADIIQEQKGKGTTILLSSHILSDVERTCDRIVLIRSAEIVFSSPIAALRDRSDGWQIELRGIDPIRAEAIANAGLSIVAEAHDTAWVTCTTSAKNEVLARLLEMQVEIGAVRRAKTLEGVYMEYVEAGSDD